MNSKGQIAFPLITFVILVFGLFFIAPIMLKLFHEVQDPVNRALNQTMQGNLVAQENFNSVIQVGINFWDKVIVMAFILAIVLLLISAFLIDTHPFWVILYIFLSFMLVLFSPDIMGALDKIYTMDAFVEPVANLVWVNLLRVHFAEFLVGLIVITGIIIYGKIFIFRNQGRR